MRNERTSIKKICVLLALVCLLVLGMTMACAENVQLSFVGESGNANAGYACEVKVKAKPAPAEDVTVPLSCKDQQEKASRLEGDAEAVQADEVPAEDTPVQETAE